MIKIIAFDLIGVLAFEKCDVLNEIEDKIERKFGPNKSDEEYLDSIKEIINDGVDGAALTNNIIL